MGMNMEMSMETLFGRLIPESDCSNTSCSNCVFLEAEIRYLKEKISLLENIVETTLAITEVNKTMLSNHNQSKNETCHDQRDSNDELQTDLLNVTNDGMFDAPDSYYLTDQNGKIEAPESLLSYNSEPQLDNLSDTMNSINNESLDIISLSNVSSVSEAVSANVIVEPPCEIIDNCPFDKFSADLILQKLTLTHSFNNRKSGYYGKYPYIYNGGTHEARDLPVGSHLDTLCSYLNVLIPDFKFNSVLVNVYENGTCFIPPHSDSEECIVKDSVILTVSLGAIRTIKFSDKINGEEVQRLDLRHGELISMTQSTQNFFKHEILPDELCTEKRVSLTFRHIKPAAPLDHSANSQFKPVGHVSVPETSGYVPFISPIPTMHVKERSSSVRPQRLAASSPLENANESPANVLYISSSMFRFLDTKKLSSKQVLAEKLFYPGANAKIMLEKLKRDIKSISIPPTSIFIMTGTNNVDSIYFGSKSLKDAFNDISELLKYLSETFPNTPIKVVNILPRFKKGRNDVINELNKFIKNFCLKNRNQFEFLTTNHLFNFRDGSRIENYFVDPNKRFQDNCHLNKYGIARLGKFIKYWTHAFFK